MNKRVYIPVAAFILLYLFGSRATYNANADTFFHDSLYNNLSISNAFDVVNFSNILKIDEENIQRLISNTSIDDKYLRNAHITNAVLIQAPFIQKKPEIKKETAKVSGVISNAKIKFSDGHNLPRYLIQNLSRILYKCGDNNALNGDLEFLSEIFLDEEKKVIGYGNILYISIKEGTTNTLIYRYTKQNGNIEYININNINNLLKNISKPMFIHPVVGQCRISSQFGMRHHPILGERILHKGVDFAAPYGTPVKATCDGVIQYIGYNSGFGQYIKIKHDDDYKTEYAHLSKFNTFLKNGSKVHQGQIIGYIGTTGRSTAPHLHYGVLFKNKNIDPLKAHQSVKIQNINIDEFRSFKIQMLQIKNIINSASCVSKYV